MSSRDHLTRAYVALKNAVSSLRRRTKGSRGPQPRDGRWPSHLYGARPRRTKAQREAAVLLVSLQHERNLDKVDQRKKLKAERTVERERRIAYRRLNRPVFE